MDFERPLRVVTPSLDGDVLAVLAGGHVVASGRELHRLVGHSSEEGVRRAAERLTRQGIVTQETVGRARLYALNREHLAAAPIEALASLRLQLIERLRSTVSGWKTPAAAVTLFGSVARKEATEDSDLDLLVVRRKLVSFEDEDWRAQLEALERAATRWTGNDARVLEFGEAEALRAPPPVLIEALSTGVDVHGGRRLLRRIKQVEHG